MDRFSLENPSDLARNYSRNRFRHEIFESTPEVETMKCDGCCYRYAVPELHMIDDGTDSPLFLCADCKRQLEHEAECTCRQVDVDLVDARGCEVHGDRLEMPAILVEAGVTRAEGEAFLTWIERKPAKYEPMQGVLFPEVA